MGQMNSQLERFRAKLANFDWKYDESDDRDVYRAGKQEQGRLFSEAMSLGPEAMELYFECIRNQTPDPT